MSPSLQILDPQKFDRWIARDEVSLKFDPKTPPHVFREAWLALVHAHNKVQFYLGDAINFAEGKGQRGKYDDFVEKSGLRLKTLRDYSYVARNVPRERRRMELGFHHHYAVAPLTPEKQIALLDAAVKGCWSVSEFRKQITLPSKFPLEPKYGDALNVPGLGLQRAPINEQGVVFLFALISKQLGFDVEAIQIAFPDCIAKRLTDQKKKHWKQVRIEFEYESSNFLKHGHQHEHCDLIVCWRHDWEECPIKVIALEDELSKLRR